MIVNEYCRYLSSAAVKTDQGASAIGVIVENVRREKAEKDTDGRNSQTLKIHHFNSESFIEK